MQTEDVKSRSCSLIAKTPLFSRPSIKWITLYSHYYLSRRIDKLRAGVIYQNILERASRTRSKSTQKAGASRREALLSWLIFLIVKVGKLRRKAGKILLVVNCIIIRRAEISTAIKLSTLSSNIICLIIVPELKHVLFQGSQFFRFIRFISVVENSIVQTYYVS